MISFSRLGKKGNLGNQLFQIAATIGTALKNKQSYGFPGWPPSVQMQSELSAIALPQSANVIDEKQYHYEDIILQHGQDYDLNGWFQSARYWEGHKEKVLPYVTPKYKPETPAGSIGISIRRGDFVGNPNYFQLDINYYVSALFKHFSDWQSRHIYLFSDDVKYLKHHFAHLENCHIVDADPVTQLSYCNSIDSWIISNSTFSWWLAYLSKQEKIIRPLKNMAGSLAERSDEKDYWPENWVIHETEKLPAKDVTFTIPVQFDHNDRKQNTSLSICLLQRSFDTHIIVGECRSKSFEYTGQYGKYMFFDGIKTFHRTKMLNEMAVQAETPIIVNWDCDTVLPPLRIWSAINAIRSGADMCYPFDGNVYHVPRIPNFRNLEKHLDTGIFGVNTFNGKHGKPVETSVGHAIFFNKESFIAGGMENENFISYGPEDWERYERFTKLGFKVERITGPMYHIEHFRGIDSTAKSPFFKDNHAILERQRQMTPETLKAHVDGWEWVNRYTEAYYGRILPGAIRSAEHTAQALKALKIEPKTIIDIGCGCGEWSKGWPDAEYRGVDYKVMTRSLIIPGDHYTDCDLNSGVMNTRYKFDLCLCLEVAEHLQPEKSKALIEYLCNLSGTVLFSAAIPYQGGNGHINEQWQTYWAALFAEFGYYPAKKQPDIRNNPEIEVWYRQNIVLYEKGGKGVAVNYVHPEMWLNHFGK